MGRVPLDGRVGDPGDDDDGDDCERDHAGCGFLELAADVAAGVGTVAKSQDVERAECGHERDEREHMDMIGLKRQRT
jgi:hypothetical protein